MKENIAEIILDISVTYKWRFWMNQFLVWLVNLDLVQPLIYNNHHNYECEGHIFEEPVSLLLGLRSSEIFNLNLPAIWMYSYDMHAIHGLLG